MDREHKVDTTSLICSLWGIDAESSGDDNDMRSARQQKYVVEQSTWNVQGDSMKETQGERTFEMPRLENTGRCVSRRSNTGVDRSTNHIVPLFSFVNESPNNQNTASKTSCDKPHHVMDKGSVQSFHDLFIHDYDKHDNSESNFPSASCLNPDIICSSNSSINNKNSLSRRNSGRNMNSKPHSSNCISTNDSSNDNKWKSSYKMYNFSRRDESLAENTSYLPPIYPCKCPKAVIEEAVVLRKGFCASNIKLRKKDIRLTSSRPSTLSVDEDEDKQKQIRTIRKAGLQIAAPASSFFHEVFDELNTDFH